MNKQLLVITETRLFPWTPWFNDWAVDHLDLGTNRGPTGNAWRNLSFNIDDRHPPTFLRNVDALGNPADHHNEQGHSCADAGHCICGTQTQRYRLRHLQTIIKSTVEQPVAFYSFLQPLYIARSQYNYCNHIRTQYHYVPVDSLWRPLNNSVLPMTFAF